MIDFNLRFPEVGEPIYVPTMLYIDRGRDDIRGGLATISKIWTVSLTTFVSVLEIPGRGFNLAYLLQIQSKLREEFGNSRACPDPDYLG